MRMSRLFATTLRDTPAEAEVVSHQLLVRAGYIRRIASGIYTYMPLMWRVLQNIQTIIREEMNAAGAQEILLPTVQPADLWERSGRWQTYGPELMRLKDRHDREACLAPTGEEVITALAESEIKSYKQLPVNLYQISNKYRDEVRPRFGLLRGREFIMKDAYSFHATQASLDEEYTRMAEAYVRIFKRCGLDTKVVRSDSGAIGGDISHEFMMLTGTDENAQQSGENDVIYCNACDYAANREKAEGRMHVDTATDGRMLGHHEAAVIKTKKADSIEKLVGMTSIPATLICKTLLYIVDKDTPLLVMIRGDRQVEALKLQGIIGQGREIRMANEQELKCYFRTGKGFLGLATMTDRIALIPENARPLERVDLGVSVTVLIEDGKENALHVPLLVDESMKDVSYFMIAHNRYDEHTVGFNWPDSVASLLQNNLVDLAAINKGDGCPECGASLEMTRGIEVGNIFQLGSKYSKAMGVTFTNDADEQSHFLMGCYGIGVSRVAASAIEQYHDNFGIIWPMAIAPYKMTVVIANTADETQRTLGESLYAELLKTYPNDVLLDDRDERAGVKFKDADLIGIPVRITVGKHATDGQVEIKQRHAKESALCDVNNVPETITPLLS
jgi:prolyl-tRNA synthetase